MEILNKPVLAIVSFREDGEMLPLWLRLAEESDVIVTEKVDEIISRKRDGVNHIVFVCWIVAENRRRLVELRYNKPKCTWMLHRMLS